MSQVVYDMGRKHPAHASWYILAYINRIQIDTMRKSRRTRDSPYAHGGRGICHRSRQAVSLSIIEVILVAPIGRTCGSRFRSGLLVVPGSSAKSARGMRGQMTRGQTNIGRKQSPPLAHCLVCFSLLSCWVPPGSL